ncbi:MAG TPA: hypothetical protein VGD91_06535 [Trebonia sp.]
MNGLSGANTQLLRVGFIAALVLALLLIAGIFLPLDSGNLPRDGAGWLHYLHGNGGAWAVVIVLSVLGDLLLVPVALALSVVLEPAHRALVLLAGACLALFVVLDLAVTWTSYATLLALSGHSSASSLGAADYAAAVLDSPLDRIFSSGLQSLGIALISLAMLRGSGFRKVTGYLGLAAAVAGFVAVAPLPVIGIIHARVTAVWLVLAAGRLRTYYRESREPEAAVQARV